MFWSDDRPPIRFLNHASFLINSSKSTLVCDPWLSGSAFNNGWDLVWPAAAPPDIDRITHIWYSHEHPDHFSTAFLQSIPQERRGGITVLYQRTRDKRVVAYCSKLGFPTVELPLRRAFRVDNEIEILCDAVPIYDSWCRLTVNGLKILNLNDCPLEGTQELQRVKRLAGACDVLFSQFSYACWIGRPEDSAARRAISDRLLKRIVQQCNILAPKFVVPFASFIFFSNSENLWMNDGVNDPERTVRFIERHTNSAPVLMTPGEAWDGRTRKDNTHALAEWMKRYRQITALHQPKSVTQQELETSSKVMLTRVFARNYRVVILLLARLGILPAVTFNVLDLNKTFRFSWERGLQEFSDPSVASDLALGSESLDFLMRNDFGADTLYVNARFRADDAGRNKLLRAFSIPMLNNTGRFLRWSAVKELTDRDFLALGFRTLRQLR